MSSSQEEDHQDLRQIVSPSPEVLKLVERAAKDVRVEVTEAQKKPLTKMKWTNSCEEVIKYYFDNHFYKISDDSPITKIIKPNNINLWYEPVLFQFLAGNFRFDHAGVAICLFQEGQLETIVEDSKGRKVKVEWNQGAFVYLAGDTIFRASGDGRVVCIFQGFGKK